MAEGTSATTPTCRILYILTVPQTLYERVKLKKLFKTNASLESETL